MHPHKCRHSTRTLSVAVCVYVCGSRMSSDSHSGWPCPHPARAHHEHDGRLADDLNANGHTLALPTRQVCTRVHARACMHGCTWQQQEANGAQHARMHIAASARGKTKHPTRSRAAAGTTHISCRRCLSARAPVTPCSTCGACRTPSGAGPVCVAAGKTWMAVPCSTCMGACVRTIAGCCFYPRRIPPLAFNNSTTSRDLGAQIHATIDV